MSSRRPRLKIRNNDIPSKIIKFYWHVLLCFTQMKTGVGGVYDKPSQNSNYVTGVVYIYILHAVFWGGGLSILSENSAKPPRLNQFENKNNP